jgi:hypothetical protein
MWRGSWRLWAILGATGRRSELFRMIGLNPSAGSDPVCGHVMMIRFIGQIVYFENGLNEPPNIRPSIMMFDAKGKEIVVIPPSGQ